MTTPAMKTSRQPSRGDGVARCTVDSATTSSLRVAVLFLLVVSQIVSNTDQAVTKMNVVRVVRVDVPPVVRSYDAKPVAGAAVDRSPPPLLLGCAYALEGGENDDEDGGGDLRPTNATATTTTTTMTTDATVRRPLEVAMDAAMEETQRLRGLVVKWYFRRNAAPAGAADDAMAIIHDNEQVYQWIAGGGPEASGGLGPLSGRVVDVTAETPRVDKSALHRVIRVDRPTAELTGEYRCQVEDWNAERRSPWHPMVVYTPERIFKVVVDDNDDDDDDDIAEGSGLVDGNFTTGVPSTSSSAPPSVRKKWPTEINITCYAAGMHPEPSMSIWVNGIMQDSVSVTVTEDDGDDDENNDANDRHDVSGTTPQPPTTTTAKPKASYRNRYRNGGSGVGGNGGEETFKRYAVRADKVVSLREAEERRVKQNHHQRRRVGVVEVECRLRVPGDGTGGGRWKADRPADRYYGVRKSVAYKYRGDRGDAYAAASSASSTADAGDAGDDADAGRGQPDSGVTTAAGPSVAFLFAACLTAAAAAIPR